MGLAPALSDFAEAMVFGWRKFLRTVKTCPRERGSWHPVTTPPAHLFTGNRTTNFFG
jgi:hypothetical protein